MECNNYVKEPEWFSNISSDLNENELPQVPINPQVRNPLKDIPVDSPEIIDSETMDFSFMNDYDETHIRNGCRALDNLNLWKWLRCQRIEAFMLSSNPNVMKIYYEMEKIKPEVYHSGCSFALTLRSLETLAKKGYNEFKNNY